MLVRIYDKNPSERELDRVADLLERGGVVIYPTDSLYAFGCSLSSAKGVDRLHRLCGKDTSRLTMVCDTLSRLSEYCRLDDETFRLLRRNVPGPFTFLLEASSRLPAKALEKRHTIGVRIPDNGVACAIVERMNTPLLSASVRPTDDSEPEYATDPELIDERYGSEVDAVIDGGTCDGEPTTVVDLRGGECLVIRQGRGILD